MTPSLRSVGSGGGVHDRVRHELTCQQNRDKDGVCGETFPVKHAGNQGASLTNDARIGTERLTKQHHV